jgi:hypothetical protein
MSAPQAPTSSATDWPARVASELERVTTLVERRAVDPLRLVARGIVYGLIAAMLGGLALLLGTVGLVRLLNVYVFAGHDWASFALLGGIESLGGLFLWSKRTKRGGSEREG